ncbi:MAG: hypothetical protein WC059_03925 [Candidatus Paceibacterota bacterium]
MKKIMFLILFGVTLWGSSDSFAQTDTTVQNPPIKLSLKGGLFTGVNRSTVAYGFFGPKISGEFNVSKSNRLEIGIHGLPCVIISDADTRLGLSIGVATTYKIKDAFVNPVIGFAVCKTTSWQPMLLAGFVF